MTHSYVRHDLFMCVTQLIHTCDMTTDPLKVLPTIGILPLMCDMTYSYARVSVCVCVCARVSHENAFLRCAAICIVLLMCDMTHSFVSACICMCVCVCVLNENALELDV